MFSDVFEREPDKTHDSSQESEATELETDGKEKTWRFHSKSATGSHGLCDFPMDLRLGESVSSATQQRDDECYPAKLKKPYSGWRSPNNVLTECD